MKKAADHPTTSNAHGDADFGIGTMALDFLDTTWRIAVPVVLFAGLGIFGDTTLHTKPWLTLLGTLLGFGFAGLLLRKQLIAVKSDDNKKDKA
jgi:F0F1-type ATP synthase assembly protein I